jgi:hypothetical protein
MTTAYFVVGNRVFAIPNAVPLYGVHPEEQCAGGSCVVHSPSSHAMSTWPLHWREDRGFFERLCNHGVGHPDPDQTAFWRRRFDDGEAETLEVHGCCGCCGAGVGDLNPLRRALIRENGLSPADIVLLTGQTADELADQASAIRALGGTPTSASVNAEPL